MECGSLSTTLNKSENTEDYSEISKFRNYASQIYAIFATNIVKCTVGASIGFTSVLIAELYKENAEIQMSVSELSWFSSKCFMVPIGALLLGTMAHRIGTRLTILISAIVYTISFLIFYFATSSEMLLIAQAIAGLCYMTGMGPGITYTVEVTQIPLRSALSATTTFSAICTSFLVILLSNFFHWRSIALIILVFPVTGFIAVCTIPESPHWLASKNRFEEAEAALRWLRGWSSSENVASEFNALKETYMRSPDTSDSSTNKNTRNKTSFFKDKVSFYLHRSFYIPLSSMCLLFILHVSTGASPISVYCLVIFGFINAPIDPHVAGSLFDAGRILGAMIFIFSIHYTGKKKLVYISLVGAALALFTASTALLLEEEQIHSETRRWIAAIAIIFTTFSTSFGIDKAIGILNAEIFPTKYRNIGTGIGHFTNAVAQAVGNMLFLPMVEAVTLPGVFIIFGVGCIITCLIFHFMFPETEGKTLQEIEDHYNNVKKL